MITLSNFYFGPVSYFITWANADKVWLEQWENFPKQTYRNRCIIQGANGRLPLIIPIEHSGARIFKDIKICYASAWQKLHWKSLQSSYQSSPYFEYYEDSLKEIFEKKEIFLFDLNLKTLEWVSKTLKYDFSFRLTEEFYKNPPDKDYRSFFNAKESGKFANKEYIQVFSDRFSFMNDLSILDLICNIGPKSATYITNN